MNITKKIYSVVMLFFCIHLSAQQYKVANPADKEFDRIFYGQQSQKMTRSGSPEFVFRSLKTAGSRAGMNKNQELSYAVYHGDFRKVQRLLSEGADVNAEAYPSCGPKGHPIQLAVMSGSTTMTRLMIEKGGDLNYTLHAGYTNSSWGWVKASLTEISEEMGRSDITEILKSKKGLKGTVRNVGNLNEYFGFKPYGSDSSLKPVQGRFIKNDKAGKYEYPIICRYTGSYISYGTLTKIAETGKTVCDQRYYKADKPSFRDEPFEVLYHLKPLKKNQEIVWEVPNFREDGNELVYKYSFQPSDDSNVLKFCAVSDGFSKTGLYSMFFQACSSDKQSYKSYQYYHFLLTLVEFDSDSTAEDTRPTPELNMQLLKASWKGDADAARTALKSGADPNAQNKGWTGLMYAAYAGRTDVIRVLLEYSADTTVKFQGFTALSMAEKKGNTEAAALLKPADRSLKPYQFPRSALPEPSLPEGK